MVLSVFQFIILLLEAPWYCIVCYMQAIITRTKGLLKLGSLSVKKYTYNCYLLSFDNQYRYGELSKLCLFVLSRDTSEEVDLLIFSNNPE